MSKIELLQHYLDESPTDPFLHFALAKEYESAGNPAAAIERYEYLLQQHEDYVGTYYHAGKIYEKMHWYQKAMDCYDKGIQIARKARDQHSASELAGAREQLEDMLDNSQS